MVSQSGFGMPLKQFHGVAPEIFVGELEGDELIRISFIMSMQKLIGVHKVCLHSSGL